MLQGQSPYVNRNLSYKIAETIARSILNGEVEAGGILPGEVELGEIHNASRTAVREAIKMLAAKGLVLPRPRIGTRVLPKRNWNYLDQDLLSWISFEDNEELIKEYQHVRLALEPEAAASAALNATEEDKAELRDLMAEMHALGEDFNQLRWVEIDTRFHQLIYFASGNHFLSPFGNLFRAVFEKYFLIITRDRVLKLDVHQRIVEGIISGDSEKARKAVIDLLT